MSPRLQRELTAARAYHGAPVTAFHPTPDPDERPRYGVALDIWDDPDRAARELAFHVGRPTARRAH